MVMKFAAVIVDLAVKNIDHPFDYSIPDRLQQQIEVGQLVEVPFQRRRLPAYVVQLKDSPDYDRTKSIIRLLHPLPLFDEEQLPLIYWLAEYYQSLTIKAIKMLHPPVTLANEIERTVHYRGGEDSLAELSSRARKQRRVLEFLQEHQEPLLLSELLEKTGCKTRSPIRELEKKGLIEITSRQIFRQPYGEYSFERVEPHTLNRHQELALEEIAAALRGDNTHHFLLHGITGSGKTEIYLQAIKLALKKGGGAILLVPEIALTWQTVRRFKERFGSLVAVLHSQLSAGERFDEWQRIKLGRARVAIGARSAIFAPVNNLSLIILDEEHEWSYKEWDNPKYHARQVAVKRASLAGAITIFGSATPSLESYYQAQEGAYSLLQLPERIDARPLPPVRVIDMRKELKGGNRRIISQQLKEEMTHCLKKGEQVLLFLNRRGFSNFLLCRICGYVPRCENCDVSLTYHRSPERLFCHYCDLGHQLLQRCPQCGSRYLRHLGIGTQKVEEEVRTQFPEAAVARMDLDTTTRKGSHTRILESLRCRELDILIGTQMIAKGHDLPHITLVGVIIADTVLHFPDFRSAERTFQLLTQVSGRTGRGSKGGEVIVQTYSPEHYSIETAKNHDFLAFYRQEIELRREQNYPPFSRLINIIISSEREDLCRQVAEKMGQYIDDSQGEGDYDYLGPGPATLSRLRGKYRWQIMLRGASLSSMRKACKGALDHLDSKELSPVNVSVDIDPVSIL